MSEFPEERQRKMSLMLFTEKDYNPAYSKHYEGAFAQGNGYVHLRASFEEGLAAAPQDEEYIRLPANVTLEKLRHPRSKWGTYVPGITGIHPMLKEELVNIPNPLWLQTICDGETLDMDRCCIENYHRELNLKSGILNRSLIWKTRSDAKIACFFERFVSMSHKHLILQKVTFTAVEGTVRLVIRALLPSKNSGNHEYDRV